jgi:hypothetical protein
MLRCKFQLKNYEKQVIWWTKKYLTQLMDIDDYTYPVNNFTNRRNIFIILQNAKKTTYSQPIIFYLYWIMKFIFEDIHQQTYSFVENAIH